MSKKKHKELITDGALDNAINQLYAAVIRTAADQFEGEDIPINRYVKTCDELMLSTIRNLITTHFSTMKDLVEEANKEKGKQ